MPSTLPRNVREAWGEEVADDFAGWLDQNFQERTVHRDEYREVLSRLDVLEERFDHVDERFDRMDERFDRMDERFDRMEDRFEHMEDRFEKRFARMDEKLDRMNDRILSMTRWLIGLLVLFGTMVTVLLGVAQFTA
jgi:predicted nuclease with TOPRIM domain